MSPEETAKQLAERVLKDRQDNINLVVEKMINQGLNPDDYNICDNFLVSSLDFTVPYEIWITPKK